MGVYCTQSLVLGGILSVCTVLGGVFCTPGLVLGRVLSVCTALVSALVLLLPLCISELSVCGTVVLGVLRVLGVKGVNIGVSIVASCKVLSGILYVSVSIVSVSVSGPGIVLVSAV